MAILGYISPESENDSIWDCWSVLDSDNSDDSDDSDSTDYVNWPWNHSVDWVKDGAVTQVKDQGHCGACWAFSAIGALEGAYFVKHKELFSFSEQQLIDCAHDHLDCVHNKGCKGGYMDLALEYFLDNYAMLESEYPYTSGDTGEN